MTAAVQSSAARGQSHVVGVAVLLGITVIALAALTAGVGTVIQSTAATADAARVADGFERSLRPVETTGTRRGEVVFAEGRLDVVERDLRIVDGTRVRRVRVDALVYDRGDRRVAFLAGAVIEGEGAAATLHRKPPITASQGVLVVGAPRLNASPVSVGGTGRVAVRTEVTHERIRLGRGRYRVAIETATPAAWREAFRASNATVLDSRDIDGDGVDSVLARFPGQRTAYLVVHDMRLEVET